MASARPWCSIRRARPRSTTTSRADIWFFPKGHGHSIQTIGDKPCHFILNFDNGSFSEHGTFSITDWVDVSPHDMLAKSLGLTPADFDAFPKGETYIQSGPIVPVAQAVDAPWPKESTHKFRLLADARAKRDYDGGARSISPRWTSGRSPRTMSGARMVIKPGQIKELHWESQRRRVPVLPQGQGPDRPVRLGRTRQGGGGQGR